MARVSQISVKHQNDDSDIELLEDSSVSTSAATPQSSNQRVRLVPTSELTYGYSGQGTLNSRIIVQEDDNPSLCRQYSLGRGSNSWYCLGCSRLDKKNLKNKANLNGPFFEAPGVHACDPQTTAAAMEEQQTIKKKYRIAGNSPTVQSFRKRTRSPRTRSPLPMSIDATLDGSSAASTPATLKNLRQAKKAKLESTPHTPSGDETSSNSLNDENAAAITQEPEPAIILPSMLEVMTNNDYADVLLISSDEQEIPSHRVLLAKYSPELDKIFKESTEIPIKIKVEDSDADIVKAAIQFCYGDLDAIKEKESSAFKFAMKYQIEVLKDACVLYFKNSVNAGNVCELIQIAYENGFDDLKTKCLKVLVEKQKEIPAETVDALPGKILADALRYKTL